MIRKIAKINWFRVDCNIELCCKNNNLQMKNNGIFHSIAQNIDFGYTFKMPNKYPHSIF